MFEFESCTDPVPPAAPAVVLPGPQTSERRLHISASSFPSEVSVAGTSTPVTSFSSDSRLPGLAGGGSHHGTSLISNNFEDLCQSRQCEKLWAHVYNMSELLGSWWRLPVCFSTDHRVWCLGLEIRFPVAVAFVRVCSLVSMETTDTLFLK